MGDSNVNQKTSTAPKAHEHGHKRPSWWRHRFSEEELRVFKECKRESFLYRALPLATALGAITYAAVAKGYLKPNARFGALPKVTLAVILGYGIGKFSYRKTCMKKMMALPNSNLGQFLRDRRGGCGPWGRFPSREGVMMMSAGADPRDLYWGAGPLPADLPKATDNNEA